MGKSVADQWYGTALHEDDIVHIRELHIDPYAAGDIWLIRGSERDLVFDTGTGIQPLGPVISALSDKPRIALTSCYYYDHAGGLHEFSDRACHRLEADLVTRKPAPSRFASITEDSLYALPYDGYSARDYVHQGAVPTRLLEDGEVIDLGDRKFQVLHIPGRTPGSIALWEAATGYLFGGETAFIDPMRRSFPPEDTHQYEQSLRRLGSMPVTRIFGGHFGSFGPEQLSRLVDEDVGRYHH